MMNIAMSAWHLWFTMPTWQVWFLWLSYVAAAIMLAVLMAQGVLRLRTAHGNKWASLSLCAFSLFLCLVGSVASFHLAGEMRDHARRLKDPSPPVRLSPDWGSDFTKERRTELSRLLAQSWFVDLGAIVDYIDLNGTLRPFEPAESDRRDRAALLRYLEDSERTSTLLLFGAIGWFLAPWGGLAIAFMPWSRRLLRARGQLPESRRSPRSGAPLR